MAEYYQLQRNLLLTTLALMGIIFIPVWYFYSLNIALNYLLGASVGLVYLRMLGKEVERLGQSEQRLGAKGLGVFIILIIVASKWQQLHILPVFLGFLTYKPAIVIYTVQSIFWSAEKADNDG
ncbi:MAG: ATP synthase subunit I [Waterburya sp.]